MGTTTDDAVALLADPRAYPDRPARVEHVQTHISHVFLAGSYVYKLKKPVRFPFLDFSTPALREHFCREELRLNGRLSPHVYLDVQPVTRAPNGACALAGDGEPIEHVLRMRRLPADRMLPALLADGAVDAAMIARLARLVADFHARAPSGPEIAAHASADALATRWNDTLATLAPFVGTTVAAEDHALLADFGRGFLASHAELLRTRQEGGRIRDGHGDLHAEHVCFVEEPAAGTTGETLPAGIYVFDCIEFSVPFRCNDVASEIAFLTMDLERRGRPDLADAFARAYVAAAADPAIERLLPYYASARACVRAAVACLTTREPEVPAAEREAAAARAREYVALAVRCAWRADGPILIACAGLSGTGKSTLAATLAEATGFEVLRSDVIRKREPVTGDGGEDASAAPGAPYGAGRYTPAARTATYRALATAAGAALAAGRSVIADATFIRRADREALAEAARRQSRPYVFVECNAPEEIVRARLAARTIADESDARWETYVEQRRVAEPFAGAEPRLKIETGAAPEVVRAEALQRLWAWRRGA